jgi:hypothetical protein
VCVSQFEPDKLVNLIAFHSCSSVDVWLQQTVNKPWQCRCITLAPVRIQWTVYHNSGLDVHVVGYEVRGSSVGAMEKVYVGACDA